jgi:hypothetical protein
VIHVTTGQRHDSPQFQSVLERIRVTRASVGRPRWRPERVRADGHTGPEKDFVTLMASAAAELAARGARVVGQIVQRRGVSDGGVQKMGLPYSSRTLLSYGKVREVAQACERANADAVIFVASLTERQRHALTALLGCPAVSLSHILAAD